MIVTLSRCVVFYYDRYCIAILVLGYMIVTVVVIVRDAQRKEAAWPFRNGASCRSYVRVEWENWGQEQRDRAALSFFCFCKH